MGAVGGTAHPRQSAATPAPLSARALAALETRLSVKPSVQPRRPRSSASGRVTSIIEEDEAEEEEQVEDDTDTCGICLQGLANDPVHNCNGARLKHASPCGVGKNSTNSGAERGAAGTADESPALA